MGKKDVLGFNIEIHIHILSWVIKLGDILPFVLLSLHVVSYVCFSTQTRMCICTVGLNRVNDRISGTVEVDEILFEYGGSVGTTTKHQWLPSTSIKIPSSNTGSILNNNNISPLFIQFCREIRVSFSFYLDEGYHSVAFEVWQQSLQKLPKSKKAVNLTAHFTVHLTIHKLLMGSNITFSLVKHTTRYLHLHYSDLQAASQLRFWIPQRYTWHTATMHWSMHMCIELPIHVQVPKKDQLWSMPSKSNPYLVSHTKGLCSNNRSRIVDQLCQRQLHAQ